MISYCAEAVMKCKQDNMSAGSSYYTEAVIKSKEDSELAYARK